jgi:hypothetical protein
VVTTLGIWHTVLLGAAAVLCAGAGVVLLVAFPFLAAGVAKMGLLLIAAAISVVGYVLNRAVRARREPFCIFCGYNLTGLPDHYRCPECGRPYTWSEIEEYRQDPQWFIERWKARQSLPPADVPLAAKPSRRPRSRDGT